MAKKNSKNGGGSSAAPVTVSNPPAPDENVNASAASAAVGDAGGTGTVTENTAAQAFGVLDDDVIKDLLEDNEETIRALPGFREPQSREEAVALLVMAGISAPSSSSDAAPEVPLTLPPGLDNEPLTEAQMQEMAGKVIAVIPSAPALLPYVETAGYTPRSPSIVLSGRHAVALNYLLGGLVAQGAHLPSGTLVKSHAHAVAWVLEHVAVAAGLADLK
jgi:hypothetical protein